MTIFNDSQLKLRLPSELKQKMEESAKREKRSMNAEIVSRLEDSLLFDNDLSSNSKKNILNPYLLIDRKHEISERLIKSLEWINSYNKNLVKYSHIAENCGYEHADILLKWLKAEIEPNFKELRLIAEYLGVDQDWLVHGDNCMIPIHLYTPQKDLNFLEFFIKDLENKEINALYFIRNSSPHDRLLILKHFTDWKIEIFTIVLNKSSLNDSKLLKSIQNYEESLNKFYQTSTYKDELYSYLVSTDTFDQILQLHKHPLGILKTLKPHVWWES